MAELLYIAYNRDESEIIQLSKLLDAQYDALYSTGKDVLKKRQEKIEQEINIAAIDMATDSILKADRLRQVEELEFQINKTEKIRQKASELVDTYKGQLNPRVYQLAKKEIDKTAEKEKPGLKEPQTASPTKKVVRRRKIED